MKHSKMVLWAIIIIFIGIVIFQNQDFFLAKQNLRLNLGIVDVYESPQMPVAVILLLFFIGGLIIAYLFGLPERFRARKMIKNLNAANSSLESEVANLKRDAAALRGESTDSKVAQIAAEPASGTAAIPKEAEADFSAEGEKDRSKDFDAGRLENSDDESDESRPKSENEMKKGDFTDNPISSTAEKNT